MPKQTKRRKVKVPEALEILVNEESGKLIDMDKVVKDALAKVEQEGIIFLDEIDKITGRDAGRGPDVSREGVQRDLLPLVGGLHRDHQVRHGASTDHVLFIRGRRLPHQQAGSDLVPELQGRFPIRVELKRAHRRRLRAHPHRAGKRAHHPVHRLDGNRAGGAGAFIRG